MNELRAVLPVHIERGAMLRADGVAVGLVYGGAPAWDLLAQSARAQTGADYHRLLLALDGPVDLYVVDQAPDVAVELRVLHERQSHTAHPQLQAVLAEMADYLTDLTAQSGNRTKQVVWAVSANSRTNEQRIDGLGIRTFLQRGQHTRTAHKASVGRNALARATDKARRLTDALAQLGGTPAPRLMEAEEIARLVYQLADPMRAQRYSLAGTLLERVRCVTTT